MSDLSGISGRKIAPRPTKSGRSATVVGEAVVDLVQEPDGRYTAHPGGSPLNVAVGLARLGHRTRFAGRLAAASFGRRLREHLAVNGVDLGLAVEAPQPATLAVVSLDQAGGADYDFYVAGTADWQWTSDELAGVLDGTGLLHTGSLACFLRPGADHVAALLKAAAGQGVLTSFDPNIRPGLLAGPDQARQRVAELLPATHLLKASDQDAGWLYPDRPLDQVARSWLAAGARLVVLTRGAAGATAWTQDATVEIPAPAVTVVDTIGAGDAFTAGLLAGLLAAGVTGPEQLVGLTRADLAELVQAAAVAAAITCTRPGADPPTAAEVAAWQTN